MKINLKLESLSPSGDLIHTVIVVLAQLGCIAQLLVLKVLLSGAFKDSLA